MVSAARESARRLRQVAGQAGGRETASRETPLLAVLTPSRVQSSLDTFCTPPAHPGATPPTTGPKERDVGATTSGHGRGRGARGPGPVPAQSPRRASTVDTRRVLVDRGRLPGGAGAAVCRGPGAEPGRRTADRARVPLAAVPGATDGGFLLGRDVRTRRCGDDHRVPISPAGSPRA